MRSVVVRLLFFSLSLPAFVLAGQTREGYLMPAACSNRSKGTPQEHTTECALEPDCVTSGFGLWSDGTFQQFDKAGHLLALEYFKTTSKTHDHRVRVTGDFSGATIVVEQMKPVTGSR